MNILGTETADLRCSLTASCGLRRSPTPITEHAHHVFSGVQRKAVLATGILLLAMAIVLLTASARAMGAREYVDTAMAEHQAAQDLRIADNGRRLDRLESRLSGIEENVNRIIGFGAGLGCLALMLQIFQLVNTRQAANQVLKAVQEKESKMGVGA